MQKAPHRTKKHGGRYREHGRRGSEHGVSEAALDLFCNGPSRSHLFKLPSASYYVRGLLETKGCGGMSAMAGEVAGSADSPVGELRHSPTRLSSLPVTIMFEHPAKSRFPAMMNCGKPPVMMMRYLVARCAVLLSFLSMSSCAVLQMPMQIIRGALGLAHPNE